MLTFTANNYVFLGGLKSMLLHRFCRKKIKSGQKKMIEKGIQMLYSYVHPLDEHEIKHSWTKRM